MPAPARRFRLAAARWPYRASDVRSATILSSCSLLCSSAVAALRSASPTLSSSRTPPINGPRGLPLPKALAAVVSALTGRSTPQPTHQARVRLRARTAAPPPNAIHCARLRGASTNSLGSPIAAVHPVNVDRRNVE